MDQYDYDTSFYKSVPEIKTLFQDAATRIAPESVEGRMLGYLQEKIDDLAQLPDDRAKMNRAQRERAKDAKMAFEIAVSGMHEYPQLRQEVDSMFKIITKNIQP